MRHLVVGVVLQVKLHRVSLAHANEAARHRSAEGPEGVGHPLGDFPLNLAYFELDNHLRRMSAMDRRRNFRWTRKLSANGVALWRPEISRGGALRLARPDSGA